MSSSVSKIKIVLISSLLVFITNFEANGGQLLTSFSFYSTGSLFSTSIFLHSLPLFNSPIWFLFGIQNPYSNVTDDSTSNSPVLLQRAGVDRFSGAHPKSDPNFKYRNNKFKDKIKIDSAGNSVSTQIELDSLIIGYPYTLGIDEYLAIRKKQLENRMWDSLLARYDLKQALSGGDLARLISQATGMTIPIPPNPVIGLFGKPQININVSGEVNLKVGWRWDSQNLGTVSAFGQTQSTPIFSQDIRVNVSGSIGDKLKLKTDWNTRRQFEYDNKFKIGYEGEDDEIIKLVELGNVSLPVPSSLIGGGEALFGVRSDYQFGPLYLKTIFSQRRGERKFINVKGGVSTMPFEVRAYDFSKNHFFVDEVYKSLYQDYFKFSSPVIPSSVKAKYNRIKQIEVWESTNDIKKGAVSAVGVAFDTLTPKRLLQGEKFDPALKFRPITAGQVERGYFLMLDSNRYRIDLNLGTLHILSLRPDRFYAVSYRIEGDSNFTNPDDDLYYGTLASDVKEKDTLILKLIYRPNMQPGFKTLWDRQMKNIYSINASFVDVNSTKIGLWYINQNNDSSDVLPGAPDKLVTIFGVDRVNTTGSAPPDGQFDLREPIFDSQYGELIFPSLRPFDDGLRDYFNKLGTPELADQYVFKDIYDTTYDIARRNTGRDRFIITGEVSGKATNRINLGAFNLAPNSVKVTLDGVPLREYDDYVIDYYAGQLTLRNQRASLPNANLKIEYEARDVFNISTRTLAGIRGDYQLYKSRKVDTKLGFTLMHYDQSALIDRVRLGEEPVANTMLGFDANLDMDAPWVTKALDFLPFYDTKVQSSFQLRGEWAMTIPQPNKRTSDVESDNFEPVVYIDDFEGAQRYIPLGLTAAQWSHSSQPVDSSSWLNDSVAASYRANAFWYQYFIPNVDIREPYPNKDVAVGRSKISPLFIDFDSKVRGIYNFNPKFQDTVNRNFNPNADLTFVEDPNNKDKIWGGMMRLFSSFNTNFDTENIDYIEIMMRLDRYEAGKTKMYIDIGQISEDIIPNQTINTEDGITDANPVANNIIDAGEDLGIDGLNNIIEKDSLPFPLNLEDDPARDDYAFDFTKDDITRNSGDFDKYNNYEGNSLVSEIGQFPDTEILNANNGQTLSLDNSYFEYEVNLNPNPLTNPQIVGGNEEKRWFLYRIPIRKPNSKVGNPLFSNIQYIRVWFKGGDFKAAIADWRLVGSQWQRISNFQSNVESDDSVMQIAFANLDENSGPPDYYSMPPGVKAPRLMSNPDPTQDLRLNEQSISLSVKNLRYGDERMAVRIFRPLDIFYYKTLKFFIHGDGSMPDISFGGATPKAYAYLRFGTDSSNYYEYRRPLTRGWQNIEIKLSSLTAIKQLRDSSQTRERVIYNVPNDPSAFFAVKGNPVLTRVQFFGLGISNPSERYPNELSTTMWVDELRLLSPEDRSDWAGIANASFKLADLGSVNASFSRTMPNFHKLEERFGDRINTTNWTVSMQGNIDKFAPKSFSGMKIPVSFTHAEALQDPEFVANNDINLAEAAEASRIKSYNDAINNGFDQSQARQYADSKAQETITRSQTLKVSDSWALTGVKLGIPVKYWLIDDTFNKLTVGYSYSQEFERSPVVEKKFNWVWLLNLQYATQISDFLAFQPLKGLDSIFLIGNYNKWKVNLLPSNISANLDMRRSRTTEKSRFLDFPSPVFRDFSANRSVSFAWKLSENGFLSPTIDYNFTTGSTLVPFELDEFNKQRTGSELANEILLNHGLVDLGTDNMHAQNVTINFKPIFPVASVSKFLDMSGSYQSNYTWRDPLQPDPTIKDVAKNAGYNAVFRYATGFRLKELAESWFSPKKSNLIGMSKPSETTTTVTETTFSKILDNTLWVFKTIFLDYDKLQMDINQTNTSLNPGVFGGTGISNFWGRGLTGRESLNNFGPSFAYQLGLIGSPHGSVGIGSSDKFPFFAFESNDGLRPPNAILPENYTQKTNLKMSTSRPLWPGAVLDVTWNTDFAFNKTQTVETDAFGNPKYTNIMATESFNRTYLSIPSVFGLDVFNNDIENVIDIYEEKKRTIIPGGNIDSTELTPQQNQALMNALSESFHDGLQAFSIFGGRAGKFLPALNWGIKWEGIEKWGMWAGTVKTATIEHRYTSKYTENALVTDNGRTTQNQQVQIGFQPLVGVSLSFDEKKLDGVLTATLRYSTTTQYQLTSANRSTIARNSTDELQAQASYTMRGFEWDFLGLKLKNDVEASFMATYQSSDRSTYDVILTQSNGKDGRKLDGNSKIIIEPRIRYNMSNRVTAAFFVRYEGTFTEGAAQPGFNTTQVGLDIRISIAGGR